MRFLTPASETAQGGDVVWRGLGELVFQFLF
jgi:hypothetical protein